MGPGVTYTKVNLYFKREVSFLNPLPLLQYMSVVYLAKSEYIYLFEKWSLITQMQFVCCPKEHLLEKYKDDKIIISTDWYDFM